MAEQKLDLFQLATSVVAQASTTPHQIMRSKIIHTDPLCAQSDGVPDDVLRQFAAPDVTVLADGAQQLPSCDSGSRNPLVQKRLHPGRHRHSSDVATFTNQI